MLYLSLVMLVAGGLTALVLNWRFLVPVCLVLLVAQAIYAVSYADLWNFVRTFIALIAFQLGYLVVGLAREMRHAWLIDKAADRRRSLGSQESSD